MSNPPQRPPQPKLELPADLQPVYANLVRISHSPVEIVFDYAALLPGSGSLRINNRILMSPIGAKLFLRALSDNIARYEAAYGEISLPHESSLANDLFRSIHPPDQPPFEPPPPEPPAG
ncbi:MAG: DUF3467 domain-containing protein [Anaerolineae bacterium]|nr:DUF3467 domain-containing protein [Anaerolineae bacterium]